MRHEPGPMDKFAERVDKAFTDAGFSNNQAVPKNTKKMYDGWTIEELIVGTNIKVGDRVEAPKHGRGNVLAILGDNAWVQTEVRDYPLTFDVKKLTKVPKPRKWSFDVHETKDDGWTWKTEPGVESVELTPEVRERIKDLL